MDLLDLLRWFMKISDWLALIAACAMGFLAGFFVPAGWWSIFTSMLISYHLFLGWLVLSSEKKMEVVRPLSYPTVTHLVCPVLIVSIGTARFIVPHFEVFCCGVAVLALFERDWLFQTAKATVPGGRVVGKSTLVEIGCPRGICSSICLRNSSFRSDLLPIRRLTSNAFHRSMANRSSSGVIISVPNALA